MSRRGNVIIIVWIFVADLILGWMWYMVLFPPKPVQTIVTVAVTLLMVLWTAIMVFMNKIVYVECIADD